MKRYTCPCCGYRTLSEEPPGTYEICTICFWEDDAVQSRDPDAKQGANKVSLREAQKNFIEIGASSIKVLRYIRKPKEKDEKDENWKPL
jgi:hypothetical protein